MFKFHEKVFAGIKRVLLESGIRHSLSSSNDIRPIVSRHYLHGTGIEIGALHNPLKVYGNVRVKYVDRLSVSELKKHYPELSKQALVDVDIIDDGEQLEKIEDGSLNFIIANHMLEHCKNPLKTLEVFFSKLQKHGRIYLSIPDKRFCFDSERTLTTFQHILDDYSQENDHFPHFVEWARYCNNIQDENDALAQARTNFDAGYSIHYHVWDYNSFVDFLMNTNRFMDDTFNILLIAFNNTEIISVLQKK